MTDEARTQLANAISLAEWLEAGKPPQPVRLPGDADLALHYAELATLKMLTIEFPSFMDGRGFSHARRLRAAGFTGDLFAGGDVLADQWQFLQRCGFDGLIDDTLAESAKHCVRFTEAYQSDQREPRPLFARKARGRIA